MLHRHKWELRERTCATHSTKHDTLLFPHQSVSQLSLKRSPPSSPTTFPLVTMSVQCTGCARQASFLTGHTQCPLHKKGERTHETRVRRTTLTTCYTDQVGTHTYIHTYIHTYRLCATTAGRGLPYAFFLCSFFPQVRVRSTSLTPYSSAQISSITSSSCTLNPNSTQKTVGGPLGRYLDRGAWLSRHRMLRDERQAS